MSNSYELILKIENTPDFLSMLKKGWIPISILDKRIYYERFILELKDGSSDRQGILKTADYYNVSESTIKRAIKFMQK